MNFNPGQKVKHIKTGYLYTVVEWPSDWAITEGHVAVTRESRLYPMAESMLVLV